MECYEFVALDRQLTPADDTGDLRVWLKARPVAEKDRWLLRAVEHPEVTLGAELRAASRKGRAPGSTAARRTAGSCSPPAC